MPDSGIMSQSMSPPPQQPPFYSPPAPPPPHTHPHNHNQYFTHHQGQGSNVDEDTHTSYLNYNGDSNGNINGGHGGHYPPQGGGGGNGSGIRSVSFINSNNPNDPNNNQNQRGEGGGMMMMLEDDGGGGGGGRGHPPPPPNNGGDMLYHHHQQQQQQQQQLNQRDLFEEIRNGGGHWSQLLRQVVLTSPSSQSNENEEDVGGGRGEGGNGGGGGEGRDDPMTGENNGGGDSAINGENNNRENEVDGGGGDGGGGRNSNSSHVVPLQIVGGSENGQFVYVGITNQDINRWITVGYLQPGDIILEIQGQQVAGYTQADVISLLHHCLRGNSATLTVAPRGSLGPELRSYLNTRFQKGSVDHALQGVVRDNLYLRTVPVTTRTPRPGEINGVDYTFLSVEEFMQLERDGSLLESGVYAGNHYGTPKPWARLLRGGGGQGQGTSEGDVIDMGGGDGGMMMNMDRGGNGGNGGGGGGSGGGKGPILPGMHPSSEGKRRRNRSNVEALGAGGGEDDGGSGGIEPPMHSPSGPGGRGGGGGSGVELGPLPANWEMAYTDNGEVYFIDHNTGTSHWLDPRLSRVQKMSLEECTEDELPFGWERIEDPHYGIYYIDHVNRRTQFENPVIQAKQQHGEGGEDGGDDGGGGGGGPKIDRNGNGGMSTDSEADSTSKFLPVHQDPPPPPPQHPHHQHQFSYDNLGGGGGGSIQNQYLPKRPTSMSKPVPPAPNPKPQNPNRLSISAQQAQQRTKTPVNEMDSHQEGNMMAPAGFPSSSSAGSSGGGLRVKPVLHHGGHHQPSYRFFTRDPTQLIGERITTTLVKSSRGLGFTIVGGDDDDGLDEFLQIKSVVAEGPACIDGKLRTGDVLVKVNGTCVLGYTHQEMVSIFQSIAPGEDVELEVCRGYPLPFDPADPNTEIVTTVAVAPLDGSAGEQQQQYHNYHRGKKHVDWANTGGGAGRGSPDSLTHSAHSLPELSNDRLVDYGKPGSGRPASVDLLLDSPKSPGGGGGGGGGGNGGGRFGGMTYHLNQFIPHQKELVTTVSIVKGNQGFGFTIADSVTGQKVKKVLDASHCGGLEEGDRLIAIDGIDLRGLSHTQVVQILKDFPIGREASLTIQRSPPNSPYHGGVGSNKNIFGGVGAAMYQMERVQRPPGVSPRSKTPTAEMQRGRPRIRDNLPERPKTPNMLDSSGGRGGEYNGLFNGDVPQLNSPLFGHNFLERLGGGQGNNVATGENSPLGGVGGGGGSNGGNGDLNLVGVRDWMEMTIELGRRQEGFGFRIVGGTEEGSQVSVGHIVPGGAAALDGRLNSGDQLIAVEGCSVIGASHHSVVQLMARSATQGKVRLTVRRPVYSTQGPSSNTGVPDQGQGQVITPIHSPGGGNGGGSLAGGSISSSMMAAPGHQGGSQSAQLPLHVTLRRRENEGFGFVIISSASKAGATIGRIVETSPADRCGELHVGDRILAVNQLDISQLHHSDVVQLIKDSGFALTLSVLPVNGGGGPTTPTTPTTIPMTSGGSGGGGLSMPQFHQQMGYHQQMQMQMQQQHSSISPAQEMENLSLKDGGGGGGGMEMGTAFISPEGQPIHFSSNHSGTGSYPDSHEPQVFSVHLSRGNRGFGFSIRGGKEFQNMPLFVLRLAEDGPAAIDGRMQVGDQILQINGIITHGMTHAQAIHLIKTGGASVHLLLRRGSVPFPFLNQMPNLTSSGFSGSGSNGQELEEQSLSNASNTNEQQQFLSQNAAAMYRDHSHLHHPHAGF